MVEWKPGMDISTWSQLNADMQGADSGAGNIAFQGAQQEVLAKIAALGRAQGLTGTDRTIADSMVSLGNNTGASAAVKDKSQIFDGYTTGSNIDWSKTNRGSFLEAASPALMIAAIAAGVGGLSSTIGGATTGGGSLFGYQPGIADTIWSENAIPGLGTALQTGSGINSALNLGSKLTGVMGGSTPNRTISGGTSPTNAGGGMAGLNLQDLYNMINPIVGAGVSATQRNDLSNTFSQAVNYADKPSPDQQFYRSGLQGLFTDPTSFFQSPVYKAAFGQGQQATERAINAQGLTGSGRELTALQDYGQTFGWNQLMQQAGLFGNLSGVAGDATNRTNVAGNMIKGGVMDAQMQGAIAGDLSTGAKQLLGTGQGGSSLGSIPLSTIFNTANSWFNNSDSTQGADLLSQQDGFNWSGVGGVVGGSEQDMMLNNQWDWSW